MSTIYVFHQECPDLGEPPAADDVLLVYDTSTGRTKRVAASYAGASPVAPINSSATVLAVTQAVHGNRVVTVSAAAPAAITLPASSGSGIKYTFQMQVAATGTAHTIKVANGTDIMQGNVYALTTSSDNVIGYKTSATSDTITLNGTTQGGVVGDIVEITDVKAGFFSVKLFTAPTGTYATPFSASVS